MEEEIKMAKHEIAILTENILYNRIRALNEDDSRNEESKEEIREEMINVFVQEYVDRYKELSREEIREHVLFVLNRTIENIKKQKEDIGR